MWLLGGCVSDRAETAGVGRTAGGVWPPASTGGSGGADGAPATSGTNDGATQTSGGIGDSASGISSTAVTAADGTSSTGMDGTTSGGSESGGGAGSVGQLCIDLINGYRAQVDAPPLASRSEKESCVAQQCAMDSASGQVHGTLGFCGELNQSQCDGSPRPPEQAVEDCLSLFFAEGPGPGLAHAHYEMMVSDLYAGAACYVLEYEGGFWFIVDYF